MKNTNIFRLKNVEIPEYHVSIVPQNHGSFQEQLNSLVASYEEVILTNQLKKKYLVFAKIFLSDYINQKAEIENNTGFSSIIKNCVVSVIEQPPLNGTKINVLLYFVESNNISISKEDNVYIIEIEGKKHIYQSISIYNVKDPYIQTKEAFLSHIKLLSDNGLSLKDNCERTWLYCRDIDKDYLSVVKGRNEIFDEYGLTTHTHFIASTGIEGKGLHPASSVNIDFYSIENIKEDQIQYLKAPDYLNNTYEYGVSFERGTSISYIDKKHIFISGTASIDKNGDCVHRRNVLNQTERLFLNIKMLLKNTNAEMTDIAQMIVYLRDISDYNTVNEYLKEHYTNTPKVVVLARVCRPEWLIEVECLAIKCIN